MLRVVAGGVWCLFVFSCLVVRVCLCVSVCVCVCVNRAVGLDQQTQSQAPPVLATTPASTHTKAHTSALHDSGGLLAETSALTGISTPGTSVHTSGGASSTHRNRRRLRSSSSGGTVGGGAYSVAASSAMMGAMESEVASMDAASAMPRDSDVESTYTAPYAGSASVGPPAHHRSVSLGTASMLRQQKARRKAHSHSHGHSRGHSHGHHRRHRRRSHALQLVDRQLRSCLDGSITPHIIMCINPAVRQGQLFLDNSPAHFRRGRWGASVEGVHALAFPGTVACVTRRARDIMDCLGGVMVLFPLLARLDSLPAPPQQAATTAASASDGGGDVDPMAQPDDARYVDAVVALIEAMLDGSHSNRSSMRKCNGYVRTWVWV